MHDPTCETAFGRGARLFDQGAFFEAHEAWEERWRIATDEVERRYLQGLIQVAAALHKLLVMGSAEPATRLFARALAKLDACPEVVEGFDLASFRAGIHRCAEALAAGQFHATAIPRMLT